MKKKFFKTFDNSVCYKALYKYLLALCSVLCLPAIAQSSSERIINGVVEVCDTSEYDRSLFYNYTTIESRDSVRKVQETYELTTYDSLFLDYPDSNDEIQSMLDFREWLYASFRQIGKIAHTLSGKSLSLSIYRKADGNVICRKISLTCQKKLLDLISSDEIKQMINMVNSYKFKPSKVKGKYYLSTRMVMNFKSSSRR